MDKTATPLDTPNEINDGILYRVSPPMENYEGNKYEYVILSDGCAFAVETYIFPSNIDGDVVDWGEMPGSQRGQVTHEQVLREIGYSIVKETPVSSEIKYPHRCPACQSPAYVGFNAVDCSNPHCDRSKH